MHNVRILLQKCQRYRYNDWLRWYIRVRWRSTTTQYRKSNVKDAPILVLDEATAFADPDNEAKVQEAFANLSKGKTVIMIAHRLSTVTNADKIYVLKEGRIAEQGTHNELNNKGGIYTHMWSEYNKSVNWKVGVR